MPLRFSPEAGPVHRSKHIRAVIVESEGNRGTHVRWNEVFARAIATSPDGNIRLVPSDLTDESGATPGPAPELQP